jgi:hypothetical protein
LVYGTNMVTALLLGGRESSATAEKRRRSHDVD